jgi:hypothetical protein
MKNFQSLPSLSYSVGPALHAQGFQGKAEYFSKVYFKKTNPKTNEKSLEKMRLFVSILN